MVNMKREPLEADWVVDLTGIEDLREIQEDGDAIRMSRLLAMSRPAVLSFP